MPPLWRNPPKFLLAFGLLAQRAVVLLQNGREVLGELGNYGPDELDRLLEALPLATLNEASDPLQADTVDAKGVSRVACTARGRHGVSELDLPTTGEGCPACWTKS